MGKISATRAAIVGLVVFIALANPCSARSTLSSGHSLSAGQSLKYAQYIFASGTSGKGGAASCKLRMQSDGNLVIYAGKTPVWSSGTSGVIAPYYLSLQGDGNVVIYGPSGAIWATNTAQDEKKLP
ncbi:hypothetical protein SUGI_0101670 [Cryptomeria japonica]|nr:hypothetical protein SUGI_0101670 [Cryptomeria japonica]